jgi:hypothetical protein
MLVNAGVNSREVNICLAVVPGKESPARQNSHPLGRSTDCHRIRIICQRGDSLEMRIASWELPPRSFLLDEDRYKVTVPSFTNCSLFDAQSWAFFIRFVLTRLNDTSQRLLDQRK